MEAREIKTALRAYYTGMTYKRQYVFFEELRIGTGYGRDAEQYIDAWVMDCYPSTGMERTSFEIKVSRGDFLAELKNPLKRRAGLLVSNRFYFVTPVGLVKPAELPLECGLIEYNPASSLPFNTVTLAPYRDTGPASWRFLASIARRVNQLESTKER